MQTAQNNAFGDESSPTCGKITSSAVAFLAISGLLICAIDAFVIFFTWRSGFRYFNITVCGLGSFAWYMHAIVATPYAIVVTENHFRVRRLTSLNWKTIPLNENTQIRIVNEMLNGERSLRNDSAVSDSIHIQIAKNWHLSLQRGWLDNFDMVAQRLEEHKRDGGN